jgi:hypothetical protein
VRDLMEGASLYAFRNGSSQGARTSVAMDECLLLLSKEVRPDEQNCKSDDESGIAVGIGGRLGRV